MIITNCSQHEEEEAKYICIHPNCLNQANNKLCCIQCFNSEHCNKKLNLHKFMNIQEVEKKAIANSYKLKDQLEVEILKNQELQKKFEYRLAEVLNSLVSWQNYQKKIFTIIADNSNRILIENLMMANNLQKTPSLDSLINFYKLNLEDNQAQYSNIRVQTTRYLDYQMNEIEQKKNLLITQKTPFSTDFLNFTQVNSQIQQNCLNDQEFEICKKHQNKIKMLCTHLNCLSNQPLKLLCKNCIIEEHQEHYSQRYVKNFSQILKEQEEKTELIEQLKKQYSIDIKEQTDKNLSKIFEKQVSLYQNFENQKEQAFLNEQQLLNEIEKTYTPNYILNNIDLNLLNINKESINVQYQHIFESQNKYNDDLQFCNQLDINPKTFVSYITNLQQEFKLNQSSLVKLQKTIEQHYENNNINDTSMKQQTVAIQNLQSQLNTVITTVQQVKTEQQLEKTNSNNSFQQIQISLKSQAKDIQDNLKKVSEIYRDNGQTDTLKGQMKILLNQVNNIQEEIITPRICIFILVGLNLLILGFIYYVNSNQQKKIDL